MKKKILYSAVLSVFLTSCAHNPEYLQDTRIDEENITDHQQDGTSHSETFSETEDLFDKNDCFSEYSSLTSPASISGIEFIEKKNDRYVFSFPDNKDTAAELYNEYGALLQSEGFILEEYEGNYIIKDEGESIAFMGTGHNPEYDYILMIAFYTDT